jgi:hypothetical protein
MVGIYWALWFRRRIKISWENPLYFSLYLENFAVCPQSNTTSVSLAFNFKIHSSPFRCIVSLLSLKKKNSIKTKFNRKLSQAESVENLTISWKKFLSWKSNYFRSFSAHNFLKWALKLSFCLKMCVVYYRRSHLRPYSEPSHSVVNYLQLAHSRRY